MSGERTTQKQRLLIFIVAYNAAKTIRWVLSRVPSELSERFNVEVLVIDDASKDDTFEYGDEIRRAGDFPFPLHVLFNPVNQGYGGNQKIGYHYAIENGFDFVALVHGDGQYAPEELPRLMEPLATGDAEAVFGSRMMEAGKALKGGMPLYKYAGNRILSIFENRMLRTRFTEFHSGYRIYATDALKRVPFHLNTNDFHFDTEIIIQFVFAGHRIKELPIPTYYGDEICHVNGIKYAGDVVGAVLKARLQEYSLLYDRKFDCRQETEETYKPKFDMPSPHRLALDLVPEGARILDLGCAGGYVAQALRDRKSVHAFGVDMAPLPAEVELDGFLQHDLEQGLPERLPTEVDVVLMLDVLEHLSAPERFLEVLRDRFRFSQGLTVMASTGNVAFFVTRLLHLLGMFNYGKKGILDITHKRLLTRKTFRNLFEQNGYEVLAVRAVPGPWQMILGNGFLGRAVTGVNAALCKIWPSMFAYQFFVEARPLPHLDFLLRTAHDHSSERSDRAAKKIAAAK